MNRLEKIGFVVLVIGGILFLIDNFFEVELLNPLIEFRKIILYVGLGIWAIGLMQKESRNKNGTT